MNIITKLLDVSEGFTFLGINIKFYGLIIAIAMLVAIFVVCKIAKYRDIKTDDIILLAIYILPLSIIGARLYFVIFSGQTFTFWQVFEIWKGGMAIYGGIIGGAIGATLFCLIHKKDFLKYADIAVVGLILGQGIGRIGCYFAGCCYGIEVTNIDFQWFPLSTFEHGAWHLSTFFYESFFDILGFIALILVIRKNKTKGSVMALYLMIYGAVRCVIEGFRGDSLYLWSTGIRVSQLLSAILIVVGIVLMVIVYTKKKRVKNNETINKTNS